MTRYALTLLLLGGLLSAQDRGDRLSRIMDRDADGDGKISRDEFPGPDRFFDRLDADSDGFVTKEEVAAIGGRGGGMRGGRGGQGGTRMLQQFDTDGDGKVTDEEWSAFFKKHDENGDGILDTDELMAGLRGRSYNDKAPKVGDAAPGVKAKLARSGREVDLSKPTRLTVLAFGSWT